MLPEQPFADFAIFDSPSGERVLKKLERICDPRCRQYGTDLDGGPEVPDISSEKTLYREGMRSVYWYLVTMCENGKRSLTSKEDNGSG